jgi:hypothetical protein
MKKIVYTAIDNGVDGLGKSNIRFASFNEEETKDFYLNNPNKNWLRLNEEIIDVEERTKGILSKLDGIDKLILRIGMGDYHGKKA